MLFTRYWVQVTQIKNIRADLKQGYQTNVTGWSSKFAVDSGTTGLFLARDIFNSLLSDMGLQKAAPGEEFPSIPCSRKADNASIEFGFGANSIKIPYSALIFPRGNSKTDCVLAMGTAGNATDDGDLWSNLGRKSNYLSTEAGEPWIDFLYSWLPAWYIL